jgi:hypothetical protein
MKLKAIISDTRLYLHHKDKLRRGRCKRDVGLGACAYQMLMAFEGDPKDEGRMRIGDTGPRQIIQWISKGWTGHELTLPVFYRESWHLDYAIISNNYYFGIHAIWNYY